MSHSRKIYAIFYNDIGNNDAGVREVLSEQDAVLVALSHKAVYFRTFEADDEEYAAINNGHMHERSSHACYVGFDKLYNREEALSHYIAKLEDAKSGSRLTEGFNRAANHIRMHEAETLFLRRETFGEVFYERLHPGEKVFDAKGSLIWPRASQPAPGLKP